MMTGIRYKFIEKSEKYKYVSKVMDKHGNYFWRVNGIRGRLHKTERGAAINADKSLIAMGRSPVNILVPKH